MGIERVLGGRRYPGRDRTRARHAPGLDARVKRRSLKAGRHGPQGCKLTPCRREHHHHRRVAPFCAPTLHRPSHVGEHRRRAPPMLRQDVCREALLGREAPRAPGARPPASPRISYRKVPKAQGRRLERLSTSVRSTGITSPTHVVGDPPGFASNPAAILREIPVDPGEIPPQVANPLGDSHGRIDRIG